MVVVDVVGVKPLIEMVLFPNQLQVQRPVDFSTALVLIHMLIGKVLLVMADDDIHSSAF